MKRAILSMKLVPSPQFFPLIPPQIVDPDNDNPPNPMTAVVAVVCNRIRKYTKRGFTLSRF